MKVVRLICLFLTGLLVNCATGTFTRKVIIKRDRYGESPVIDMRDMISVNEKKFAKKK